MRLRWLDHGKDCVLISLFLAMGAVGAIVFWIVLLLFMGINLM